MAMMLSWRLIGLGLERGDDRVEVRMKLYVWAYRTDLIAVQLISYTSRVVGGMKHYHLVELGLGLFILIKSINHKMTFL